MASRTATSSKSGDSLSSTGELPVQPSEAPIRQSFQKVPIVSTAEIDVAGFNEVLSYETALASGAIEPTVAANTTVFSLAVCPRTLSSANTKSRIAHIAEMFLQWNGEITFQMYITKAIFQQIKLVMAFIPHMITTDAEKIPATELLAYHARVVINPSNDSEATLHVPFISGLNWLSTGASSGAVICKTLHPMVVTQAAQTALPWTLTVSALPSRFKLRYVTPVPVPVARSADALYALGSSPSPRREMGPIHSNIPISLNNVPGTLSQAATTFFLDQSSMATPQLIADMTTRLLQATLGGFINKYGSGILSRPMLQVLIPNFSNGVYYQSYDRLGQPAPRTFWVDTVGGKTVSRISALVPTQFDESQLTGQKFSYTLFRRTEPQSQVKILVGSSTVSFISVSVDGTYHTFAVLSQTHTDEYPQPDFGVYAFHAEADMTTGSTYEKVHNELIKFRDDPVRGLQLAFNVPENSFTATQTRDHLLGTYPRPSWWGPGVQIAMTLMQGLNIYKNARIAHKELKSGTTYDVYEVAEAQTKHKVMYVIRNENALCDYVYPLFATYDGVTPNLPIDPLSVPLEWSFKATMEASEVRSLIESNTMRVVHYNEEMQTVPKLYRSVDLLGGYSEGSPMADFTIYEGRRQRLRML